MKSEGKSEKSKKGKEETRFTETADGADGAESAGRIITRDSFFPFFFFRCLLNVWYGLGNVRLDENRIPQAKTRVHPDLYSDF